MSHFPVNVLYGGHQHFSLVGVFSYFTIYPMADHRGDSSRRGRGQGRQNGERRGGGRGRAEAGRQERPRNRFFQHQFHSTETVHDSSQDGRKTSQQLDRNRGRGRSSNSARDGPGANREGRNQGKSSFFPLDLIFKIEEVDAVTLRLASQVDAFQGFLAAETLSENAAFKILSILGKVVQNDLQRQSVLKILNIVCTSRFLDSHLTILIQKLPSYLSNGEQLRAIEIVQMICQLISHICMKLPSHASKGFLLMTVLNNLPTVKSMLELYKPELAEDLTSLLDECQRSMTMLHELGKKVVNKVKSKRGPTDDDEEPPDNFADLPIFPDFHDMNWTDKLFLRANKDKGAFRDTNHYLDVQFRLLREDYIQPLRKGIREFKQMKERGETPKSGHDLRLYHKTRIIGMVCKESLDHRVQFEMTPQLKRMRWQSCKRLLYGSLVCVSMDDFDTIFFGIVTNRDIKDLEKGILQIRFEGCLEEILCLSSETFIMAETTAYFEAYRHVLEGLQEMKDALPMSRYLVECNQTIKPPKYLLAGKVGTMDLTSVLNERSRFNASSVTVINPNKWPPLAETNLNGYQMEAVQTALSKELAIIQGPPGTGKTYVGLKVTEILLENRDKWADAKVGARPLLVVCYTNHALDQFLEGILSFCPDGMVRVGSRCKTEALEEFNLKNLRLKMKKEQRVSLSLRNSIRDCTRNLKDMQDRIMAVSAKVEASTKGVVSAKTLETHMQPGQFESLCPRVPHTAGSDTDNSMMVWLSNGVADLRYQGTEQDPYTAMKAEVTAQILKSEDLYSENFVNPNAVHLLPPRTRAKLYRWWVARIGPALQRSMGDRVGKMWEGAAKKEILPDAILQQVMGSELFAAITNPLKQQLEEQSDFCVRAWLGVKEGASPHTLSQILNSKDTCHEGQVSPGEIANLPTKKGHQLYRFWLRKATESLKKQSKLARKQQREEHSVKHVLDVAKQEILPDDILRDHMDFQLFTAIRQEMFQRKEQEAKYLIRSWLGIKEFCRNPSELEILLDRLEDESGDENEEEASLNVEEEGDVIQNERLLDVEEDLFDFAKVTKSRDLDVRSAMQELGVQSTSGLQGSPEADGEGWEMPSYQRKQLAKKLQHLLVSAKPMTREEAQQVVNVWDPQLSVESRVRLYLFWLSSYRSCLQQSIKDDADLYDKEAKQLQELRLEQDKVILQEATVVGMTTTAAARYRRVLAEVACPIIILEEAAEVLEAHVVTTLHKKCQHLILIGDHQQLKPSPTVYELCKRYNMDLSLFERLVNNNLPLTTLAVQHRMRPEVACLMRHVYPKLQDHKSTQGRDHIRGVKQDVFLFHHELRESHQEQTSSKSNKHEAELCTRLCRYLLQQDYLAEKITILTAYSGQVFMLRDVMKKDTAAFKGVRVTTVDNYQGEENDIIILSLVRNNEMGSVGFLGTDNRVCVALSRARDGFYAFGNFRILAAKSDLWKNICITAKDKGQLGDSLGLRCERHPTQELHVTMAKDFDKAPEGGCQFPCGARLDPCGHVCELMCHGYDRFHEKYKCRKKCERFLPCSQNHPCTKKCFEKCGKCLFKVEKLIPMCGHTAKMECSKDAHSWHCQEPCKLKLPCGHQCSGTCGDCMKKRTCLIPCTVEVERVGPCGHLMKMPCSMPLGESACRTPCEVSLDCGHKCPGQCCDCSTSRVHAACQKKCGLVLEGCGHRCRQVCGARCLPCVEKSCGTSCVHSSCRQRCGDPCQPCKEACPWKGCAHQECHSLCHKPCSPCPQPCNKEVICFVNGLAQPHRCSGLCGEGCFCFACQRSSFVHLVIAGFQTEEESCALTKLIRLPRCGHIFKAEVLDLVIQKKCHSLPAGSALQCPASGCNEKILEMDCWRYCGFIKERQDRFQKVKSDLVASTTITPERRQKLLASLNMLTHDAEKDRSFFFKSAREKLMSKASIDVNAAFALTNQIKLVRVFEMAVDNLKSLPSSTDLSQQSSQESRILGRFLFRRQMAFLSTQQLRELKEQTLRLATQAGVASTALSMLADQEKDLCDIMYHPTPSIRRPPSVASIEGRPVSVASTAGRPVSVASTTGRPVSVASTAERPMSVASNAGRPTNQAPYVHQVSHWRNPCVPLWHCRHDGGASSPGLSNSP